MTAADDLTLDERVALIADRYEAAQLEVSGWGAVVLEPAPNRPYSRRARWVARGAPPARATG